MSYMTRLSCLFSMSRASAFRSNSRNLSLCSAMTGYLPVVSVASLLAADTQSEQLPSDALLQTWHRLRLAVLHSIWAASQIAQASQSTQPSDASKPDAIMASSPLSQQASLLSSSTSRHGHLARQLALKTVKAMLRIDWTKCNDDIKQISGVCSSCSRGNVCHRARCKVQGTTASVTTEGATP